MADGGDPNFLYKMLDFLWTAFLVPVAWLFNRQNKQDERMRAVEQKAQTYEETEKLIDLKLEPLHQSVERLDSCVNDLNKTIKEFNQSIQGLQVDRAIKDGRRWNDN